LKTGSMIMILGCIFTVSGLLSLLLGMELIWNMGYILGGILWIIIGIFRNKGYFNKNYFMAIFSIIALWGLMLLYIFLFRTNEYLESTNIFYFQMVLFILLVIFFGRAYILRLKKGNL